MFGYYLDLAIRSLKRNKLLTVLMVLAIAIGIGASMTTLTVMHLLSGDPLPGKSAHIYYPQVDPTPNTSDWQHKNPLPMMDYRSAVDLWSARRADRQALVVQSPIKVNAPGEDRPPLMLTMLSTTSDFFPMFDVPFEYGAAWTPADGKDRARVAVISSDLNDKFFDGKNSVGKTLRIRNSDVRIVGVLAPWRPHPLFYDAQGSITGNMASMGYYGKPEDVFMPFFSSLDVNGGNFFQYTCWGVPAHPGHLEDSPCVWVALWAQLDSAARASDYRAFLANYVQQQKVLGRFTHTETRMLDLMQWLDYQQVIPSNVKLQTWLAFAFLAICLFNMVGLLLAKFLRRAGEIGVRRALGASRRSVFAQCLTEAGLIGLIGGLGGWLLTLAGLWLVRGQQAPYSDLVHMDVSMFAVTFVLAVAVSLLAGALPALRASRIAPALQLKTL
jgi:putative ABC transport system permease protein